MLMNSTKRVSHRVMLIALIAIVAAGPSTADQPGKSPVQVFILAGQSNMEGAGAIKGNSRNEGKGSLEHLVKDPATAKRFAHVVDDDGKWVVRDDVWIWYLGRTGGLSAGFGSRQDRIGPEFQFGHAIGDHLDNQVLLIKTAWGGKSLEKDFRPPSSGGEVGPFYTEMLQHVRAVLADIKSHFPQYDGRGYEIAGFGWHQGWNDGCSAKAVAVYEQNMANFIRDVRKDLGVADLPFVIADSGFGGRNQKVARRLGIRRAQAAVATYPEFKGNVLCVETQDFFRPAEESPSRHGFHWNCNAETYFLIGDAMAKAMAQQLDASKESAPAPKLTAEQAFARAEKSAEIAGYSISKVQRWLHERALPDIDPQTGLYRTRGRWNYWDTAADCYPFLCWAAWLVDPVALDGPIRNVLHVEQKLCNHLDRLPTRWDFAKGAKDESISHDRLIFGASEYVKDGLIAIVEATGKDEWFERMKGIEEDVWKHGKVDTPYGKIPSTNIEVNGEQLQALIRLYTMTDDEKFLIWARRLGDYYLNDESFVPDRLRDHGCEIIGGLGLLLVVESSVSPERAKRMLPRMKKMFDDILARGCNEDGIMFNSLSRGGGLSDGWGYNYVSYLCYDMVAGEPVYRDRIAATLRNLAKPLYSSYKWEGNSIDGWADSIEGAIYLLNRVPVEEGFAWVDSEVAKHVARSHEPLETAPLWGTMKLEANGVRTVILHAMMHTRGLRALPWRRDLKLGACESGPALNVVLKAGEAWTGKLRFDIPRHRLSIGFRRDWPRMNTLPEWFTVEPDASYTIEGLPGGLRQATGEELHAGLSVALKEAGTLRVTIRQD